MIGFLFALSLSMAAGNDLPPAANLIPDVNLSAVRFISCDAWSGSGYLIGDGQLLTDNHVASGTNCVDVLSNKKLTTYAVDLKHDIALMTGNLPEIPYIKISCDPYVAGETYHAYGYSSYPTTIAGAVMEISGPLLFRQNTMVATGFHVDITFRDGTIDEGISPLMGHTVPGMSGGPILDSKGYAHGNVVAGSSVMGVPDGQNYSYEFTNTILCPKAT